MMNTNKKLISRLGIGLALLSTISISNELMGNTLQVEAKTQKEFLSEIAPYAKDIAAKNDLYASVMIAQAILETGWGNSALSDAPNYNLFGIKGSYKGESVKFNTLEDDGTGNYYTINDGFRKYPDYGASLQDYANLLTGGNDPSDWRYNFYLGTRRSQTASYKDATEWLTGRYATDTRYGSKLNQLIEGNSLTDYDAPSSGVSKNKYTVQAGDSYWSIANKHGISIEELAKLNNANNYNINPGDVLIVPKTVTSSESVSENKPSEDKKDNEVTTSSTYTVKAGDSYWSIANKFNISIEELAKLNNTDSYLIHPGQTLKVPQSSESKKEQTEKIKPTEKTEKPKKVETAVSQYNSYTVKAGDSYWAIANKFNISIEELAKLNNASSYLIHPGQKLKVPSSNSSTPENKEVSSEKKESTATKPETNLINYDSYTVKAGDSYWAIANKFNISIEELAKLNNASSYLIHPGQTLKVPSNKVSTPTNRTEKPTEKNTKKQTATNTTTSKTYSSYTVKAGDSYWAIANKFNISIEELAKLNNASSYLIHPGQMLKVPGKEVSNQKEVVEKTTEKNTKKETTNNSKESLVYSTYTVKAGDSYWAIANKFNISIEELAKLNNASSYLIHPGQMLKVPGKENSKLKEVVEKQTEKNTKKETVTNTTTSKTYSSYTVKAGDSYWAIANKFNISIEELAKLNNASSYLIHPGQMLKVPGVSNTVSENKETTTNTPVRANVEEEKNEAPKVETSSHYIVKAGDSFWKIANEHNMTIDELAKLNNRQSYLIHPGDKLIVKGFVKEEVKPKKETKPVETTNETKPVKDASENNTSNEETVKYYIVQPGDSMWGISHKHGLSISELQKLNNKTDLLIHPGDKLIVK